MFGSSLVKFFSSLCRRALGVAALALLACACPSPVRSDQIFLTKDEALESVLGKDCDLEYRHQPIPQALLETLEEMDAEPDTGDGSIHAFICRRSGAVSGYAFIDAQIGKHAPITFIVGITPQGAVSRVEVMVYREHYGAQAREPRFVRQFDGKRPGEEIEIGDEIRHITGATLSSKSLAAGVRRNLEIWRYFYGSDSHA